MHLEDPQHGRQCHYRAVARWAFALVGRLPRAADAFLGEVREGTVPLGVPHALRDREPGKQNVTTESTGGNCTAKRGKHIGGQ